jgi:3-oxoacyl-ACP reductase-like protein
MDAVARETGLAHARRLGMRRTVDRHPVREPFMATKTKPRPARAAAKVTTAPPKKAAPALVKVPSATAKAPPPTSKAPLAATPELPRTAPATAEEFLMHITALGKRIEGHVAFMGTVERLNGTSAEAKNKALMQFYQRLVGMELELNRVREELELG